MKILSFYGVVTITMLTLVSPLYATGDITRAKDDANVKALTDADEKEKVGMGPADTGKYEMDAGKKKMMKGSGNGDMSNTGDITRAKDDANVKALIDADEKEKVGMGPADTGKYEVEAGTEKKE